MVIFKKKKHFRPFRERVRRGAETALKCLVLFSGPTFVGGLAGIAWYFAPFRHDLHVDDGTRDIIVHAVLPILGMAYSIIVGVSALATPWTKYMEMRIAVKHYDVDVYMDNEDEELSPLIHGIVGTLAVAMMLSFMVLPYESATGGFSIVFGVAFVLALMYFVVRQIDNPSTGLWYIKGTPPEWEGVDPTKYREERCRAAREAFIKKNGGTAKPEKTA